MTLARRAIIQAAAALPFLPRNVLAREANASRTKDARLQPGVQMFTLIRDFASAPDACLARLASLGCQQVETLGSMGQEPEQLRDRLKAQRIVSPSQHVMPDALYPLFTAASPLQPGHLKRAWLDTFSPGRLEPVLEQAVRTAAILGQTTLVWQLPFAEQWSSDTALAASAHLLEQAARQAARSNLRLALHNSPALVQGPLGQTPLDRLAARTDPALVSLELDIGAAAAAGHEPLACLDHFARRCSLVHLRCLGGEAQDRPAARPSLPDMLAAVSAIGISSAFLDYDHPDHPWERVAEDLRATRLAAARVPRRFHA